MNPESPLTERVARLEMLVQELQRSLARIEAAQARRPLDEHRKPTPGEGGRAPIPARVRDASAHLSAPPPAVPVRISARLPTEILWDGEFWLNKLGIGLLLLGVAFLFRYTIDQGWITPSVRVAFGLAVGTGLLVAGLGLARGKRRFTPVLLGGGIAVYYIVGFAAFQLYSLIGYRAAFACMVGITLLAFFLAVRKNEVALSLIGALGGLGTPFLLYNGGGILAGVITYTCVLLAWTNALYLYRGWRSVLWVSVVGGWAVFWISYVEGVPRTPGAAAPDRRLLQGAILYAWVLFWALPLAREVLRERPTLQRLRKGDGGTAGQERDDATALHVHLLSVSTPLIALLLSRLVSGIPAEPWGWITLGCAAGYAVLAWALRRVSRPVAEAQLLAGAVLGVVGLLAAVDGDALFLALAAEAAALHLVSRRLVGRSAAVVAHVLWATLAAVLAERLLTGEVGGAGERLTDLAVLVLGVAASVVLPTRSGRLAYRFFAHAALLAWLWREFADLPNGAAYVTITWGGYAVALLVVGLWRSAPLVQRTAVATLLLIVVKLFLVDLAALEAIWRILLFLGLGGAFLFLSYSLQSLWKPAVGTAKR